MRKKITTYEILSVLLKYPDEKLIKYVPYFFDELIKDNLLKKDTIIKLSLLFNYLVQTDLTKLQEEYVFLFDRQKAFSLYLFEHIYGDSEDRGQAMVDLKNIYCASNLNLTSSELPDYIPLFLEYLSFLSIVESSKMLSEPINILSILRSRLEQVKSLYWVVFYTLEELASIKSDKVIVKNASKIVKKGFKLFEVDSTDEDWKEKSIF